MDDFTRRYHLDHGYGVGIESHIPTDPFSAGRQKEIEDANKPVPTDVIRAKVLAKVMCGGSELNRKVKQYLEKDGKVLRFYCYWDDKAEGGYRHLFHLHYFLADDTVELLETFPQTKSCGSAQSLFLKRCAATISPGSVRTGKAVQIGTQMFFVYDCDKFTKDYCMQEYKNCQESFDLPSQERQLPEQPIPPPTGFGSEADSLASCSTHLIPRRPRATPGKDHLEGIVLRFEAKLKNPSWIDKDRKFIVGFYPSDESIAVWELPVRNSGIGAGKFAERGKKKSPQGEIYGSNSFFEGASIFVSGVEFELINCDEFTRKYRI